MMNDPEKRRVGGVVRFTSAFGILLACSLLTLTLLSGTRFVSSVNSATAAVAVQVVRFFGVDACSRADAISIKSGPTLLLQDGCNGLDALAVLFAAILSFPAAFERKLAGVVTGGLALLGVNQARVISLVLAATAGQRIFDSLHVYFWQTAIIVVIGGIWYAWVRWSMAHARAAR